MAARRSFRLPPSKISRARSSPSVTGIGSGRSNNTIRPEPVGSARSMIDRPILAAPVSAPDELRTGLRAWLARAAGEPLGLAFTRHVRGPALPTAYAARNDRRQRGNVSPPALARPPSRSGIGAALPDDALRLPRDRDPVKCDADKILYIQSFEPRRRDRCASWEVNSTLLPPGHLAHDTNGAENFPGHGAAPTIEDGRHRIIEKMDTKRRRGVGGEAVRSGAMRKGKVISDQGTLGAQNAGRRLADRHGRDRRRALPASVSDRWRAVAGRQGWTPVGC